MVGKISRKFKSPDSYDNSNGTYHLMPFRFHRLASGTEVIVNETGDYLLCPNGTAERIAKKEVSHEEKLYEDLISNFFISEKPIPDLLDIIATKYRTKKSFLDNFTSLHIFVVTLRCDHTCHYCQVSRKTADKIAFDISYRQIDMSIDLMFRSPSPHITMEFQGGEPLLAFDKIQYAVQQAKEKNLTHGKRVTYVICTNLSTLNDEMLDYCKVHSILISTSYDGPARLHDANRPKSGGNSHLLALEGIKRCRESLGHDKVSALMTTTNLTLDYPIEIIDDYIQHGFGNIFLRPISPYGFALRNEKKNKYETERFLQFYEKALLYIIELNRSGVYFSEDYATIILRKIMTPFPVGYVDLQSPAGLINSVIVFNYDGHVYASDESRMLAENKDYTFRLGHVENNTYKEIFYGEKAKQISEFWSNEALPGCSDCGYQQYCGADPVHHHATQNSLVGYRPTSTYCQKNMGIINFIFELLSDPNQPDIEQIFRSWVHKRPIQSPN